jgi:hypothetical protein
MKKPKLKDGLIIREKIRCKHFGTERTVKGHVIFYFAFRSCAIFSCNFLRTLLLYFLHQGRIEIMSEKYAVFPRVEDLPADIPAEKLGLEQSICKECKESIYLLTKELDKDMIVICSQCLDKIRVEKISKQLHELKLKINGLTDKLSNLNLPNFLYTVIEEQCLALEFGLKMGLVASLENEANGIIDALEVIDMNTNSCKEFIKEFRKSVSKYMDSEEVELEDIKLH